MLFDTHAHLNMEPLVSSWQQVLQKMEKVGVMGVVVPGTNYDTSVLGLSMAKQDQRVLAGIGYHPEVVTPAGLSQQAVEVMIAELERADTGKNVTAIGEIGLDYFRLPKDEQGAGIVMQGQRRLFIAQLELAKRWRVPLLIHTRTQLAMMDALEDLEAVFGTTKPPMIFHCFSGTSEFFDAIAPFGALIGVGGMITYDHQAALRETVAMIPLESMVLETDAPFLMPAPLPKGVNSPEQIPLIAQKLATIKNIPVTKVEQITGESALRLFPRLRQA